MIKYLVIATKPKAKEAIYGITLALILSRSVDWQST